MRQHIRWRNLLAWILALVLVAAVPVQASEAVQGNTPQDTAEAEADDPVEKADTQNDYDKGVWLHVVNGSFQKEYAAQASVWVEFQDDTRNLPDEEVMKQYIPNRTNGEFAGWYTEAPREVQQQVEAEDGKYSVWHTEEVCGELIRSGKEVPAGTTTLYAAFSDKESVGDTDKLVTFYLDWNGINGLFDKCLTCTRAYQNGQVQFTAEDAAVFGLNYRAEFDDVFKNASDKWAALKGLWETNQFDGYTFKGWSTDEKGQDMIWKDTPITDGMSIYAQWEKDGNSSENFDRTDPAAGPLEYIRFNSGVLDSSLSASRHAKEGESITISAFCTPVRAEVKDITWDLKISEGMMSAKTVAVTENQPYEDGGLKVTASGLTLTITNVDGDVHGITIGVSAKSSEGKEVSAPAEATIGFVHTWDEGQTVEEADCTNGGKIHYICTTCGKEKDVITSPLEHVYENRVDSDECRRILRKPTCTEAGEKQLICLRCGVYGPVYSIPALGHAWDEGDSIPVSCNQNKVTKTCQREGCGVKETSLVPANNPQLHEWSETSRYHLSCMSDRVYERCDVCGTTRQRDEAASNPDCHAYAYESRMVVDCEQVMYTYRCVHGCGSKEVKLVKEENHVWGSWKTTRAATTVAPGELTRSCSRCGKKETRTIPRIAVRVNYNLNGGTNSSLNPITMSGSAVYLQSPTRTGYTFQGWYSDSSYRNRVTTLSAVQTQNVSVYAKWSKVSVSKAKLSSVKKGGSKKAKVKYKKVSGAQGYEVVYSTNKKLKSSKTTTTKKTSVTLKKLKKNKKYYVKVRAYKTDSAGKKVYGKYSSVKSVKVK